MAILGGGLAAQAGTLVFDGSNDYVTLSRPVANDFTLECWFRTTQSVGGSYFYQAPGLIDADASGNANDFTLVLWRGIPHFNVIGGTINSGVSLADGQWHHVAATRQMSSGQMRLYVDGLWVASGSSGTASLTASPALRLGWINGGYFFQGQMDEVRLWNVVRTTNEIYQNYARSLTGAEPGLVAYYRFEEPDGANTLDVSGHGFDGTMQGGVARNLLEDALPQTLPATDITPTSATLNGVLPDGTWRGEIVYGTNASYGTTNTVNLPPNQALDLNGTDAYVDLPDETNSTFANGFTIEAWVYPRSFPAYSRVIEWGNGASSDNVSLALTWAAGEARPYFEVYRGSTNAGALTAPTALPLNSWSHLAVTFSPPSTAVVYVDGVRAVSGSVGSPNNISRSVNYIGKSGFGGTGLANAVFDEIRIWNTALSSNTLQAWMQRPVAVNSLHPNATNLVHRYAFDQLPSGPLSGAITGAFDSGQSLQPGTPRAEGGVQVSYSGAPMLQRVPLPSPDLPALNPGTTVHYRLDGWEHSRDFGAALKFDGTDDYVQSEYDDRVVLANQSFTIEAWARRNSAGRDAIVGQGSSANNLGLVFGFRDNDTFAMDFWNNDLLTTTTFKDLDWHHWAGTFDKDTKVRCIYRDGILVASNSATVNYQGTGSLFVGKHPTGGYNFSGQIDEVRIWRGARTQSQLRDCMERPLTGEEASDANLLLYWRLNKNEDGSNETQAHDATINQNHGTLHNFASPAGWTAPVLFQGNPETVATPQPVWGTALQFDGTDDYLVSPAPPLAGVTLECWLQTTQVNGSASDWRQGMGLVDGSSGNVPELNNDCGLSLGAGKVVFGLGWYANGTHWQNSISSGFVADGKWHHVAATIFTGVMFNPGHQLLYIDGLLVASNLVPVFYYPAFKGPSIRVGSLATGVNFFQGQMDEVRIWNRARSQAEIVANMNGPVSTNETGLVTYFRLDDSTGPVARDLSTNHYDGTLFNGPVWVAPRSGALPIWNTALRFDGVDDEVNFGGVPIYHDAYSWTVEMWINPSRLGTNQSLLDKGVEGAITLLANGTLNYSFGSVGVTNFASGGAGIPTNAWTHLAVVRNLAASTVTWFINGEQTTNHVGVTTMSTPSADGLRLGRGAAGNFSGVIDELRIWNVARTQAQIRTTMQSPLPSGGGNCYAYWKFDEGWGTEVRNSIDNGYGLNVHINGPLWVGSTVARVPTLDFLANLELQIDVASTNVFLTGIGVPDTSYPGTFAITATSGDPNILSVYYTNNPSAGLTNVLVLTPVHTTNGTAIVTVTVTRGGYSITRQFQVKVDRVTLDAINDQQMVEDTGPKTVTLTGIGPLANGPYTITATSGNVGLLPDPTVANNGATATLSLRPWTNAFGRATITVLVSRADGRTTERVFQVTVNNHPANDPPVAGSLAALRLDGQTTLGAYGVDMGGASFTLELWARRDAVGTPQCLISQGSNAPNQLLQFGFTSGNTVRFAFDATNALETASADTDTSWHHWAATYDAASGQRCLYRDGVTVASDMAPAAYDGFGRLYLGSFLAASNFLAGGLDEVRIWRTARSAAQIALYRNQPLRGNEPSLIAYFRLDEVNDATAHDFTAASWWNNEDAVPVDPAHGPIWIAPPPVPDFQTWNVPMNSPGLTIFLPALDVDGELLEYHKVAQPTNGTLTVFGPGPEFTYVPTAGYQGPDCFSYRVFDGWQYSTEARVWLNVAGANRPPTITAIFNQIIEADTSASLKLTFHVADPDPAHAVSLLTTSASSSNPRLLPEVNLLLEGSGAARELTLTPAPGEIGQAIITITVTDPQGAEARTSFEVVVVRQGFAVKDLGVLPDFTASYGMGLNDLGWVVGYSTKTTGTNAFLSFGLEGTGALSNLGPNTVALGVNYVGQVTGSTNSPGGRQAFLWTNGVMMLLPNPVGGTFVQGNAINSNGWVAGQTLVGGQSRAALYNGSLTTNIALLSGHLSSVAYALNSAGWVAGVTTNAQSKARAFLCTHNTSVELGLLDGYDQSCAYGVNDLGQIVGVCFTNRGGGVVLQMATIWEGGSVQALPVHPDYSNTLARAINNLGQVVGEAQAGQRRAVLFAANTLYDLNGLVTADSDLVLEEARAINGEGAVVGIGTSASGKRAFLLQPGWTIGTPVPIPPGAVALMPDIELLETVAVDDSPYNAFFWSEVEKKLYAIRPVTARIGWRVSRDLLDATRISAVGINIWPQHPNIHVAGAPVTVEPPDRQYSFLSVIFSEQPGVAVDPGSKTFQANNTGRCVIQYLKTLGQQLDPNRQTNHFEVVRTVTWDDKAFLSDKNWQIGDPLIDTNHSDYPGKNGYVLFENSCYDGAGTDRAYDRATRSGPIIMVNTKSSQQDDLVVVWYKFNAMGVAWASQPVRYTPFWPTNAPRIIIASGLGSGTLSATDYPDKQLYNQTNSSLPGFNPNEEHALLVDNTLFALRNDLNEETAGAGYKHSAPYALLKYRAPASREWRIKVYQVVAEEAPYYFRYTGVAGNEIQPPKPLSSLPLCSVFNTVVSGPGWQDAVNGKVYAKAAGPEGANADVVVRWFYPFQPGFYHPDTNVAVGDCLAWLDRRSSDQLSEPNADQGDKGTPIKVTYDIRWPDSPVLQIGESLLNSKHGLPSVFDMANAQIIYDSLSPDNPASGTNLVRFYDPLSARTLTNDVRIPDGVKRQSIAGKDYFPDLPWHLRIRLSYDPVNRWLSFSGYLDEDFGAGEPLLLPNVLSARERDDMKQLVPDGADKTEWDDLIHRLYNLTRNPNQVDLEAPAGADEALRIGLINEHEVQVTTSTNRTTNVVNHLPSPLPKGWTVLSTHVVPEQFGSGPKAVTAGLGGVPTAQPRPGWAVSFSGAASFVSATNNLSLSAGTLTVEFYAKVGSLGREQCVFNHANGQLRIGFRSDNAFVFTAGSATCAAAPAHTDTQWHHWTCVLDGQLLQRIYRDGQLVATNQAAAAYVGTGPIELGRAGTNNYFMGVLDELRIWNTARAAADLRNTMTKRLLGDEASLLACWRFDEGAGHSATDLSTNRLAATLSDNVLWLSLNAQTERWGIPPRFVTLAENNDPTLGGGLPVRLHVIRVDDGPFRGDLKVLPGDNVFDERVTLRHSSDFGGDPNPITFEWYYKPIGADFDPTDLPRVNPGDPTGSALADTRGWILYSAITPPTGAGVNYVTTGQGGESGLITLSDNAFICRYKGYAVNLHSADTWSGWVGDPSGTDEQPRAALAEGWVKRVIRGLNPFDERVKDFHTAEVNTFASMLIQAGPRYEGPIAFNPDAGNVNSVGLIEAYQTVLDRARGLCIDGTPPVDFNPANNALLLAATKISDLYILLANEAYADAQDPTIGFGTDSGQYGSLASSIFAFQNQLDSLLDEELCLLRGRDDSAAGVAARPVYNRLYWNFTLGEGEIAYQQVYNISDQTGDGFLDVDDARVLYPQGHGDAWGHYLTALEQHYTLLRHPQFTWVPRTEFVNLAGVTHEVDFLDERKFAHAAASKAKAGKEIIDLTYRRHYVEDPSGQWQGYKDTDTGRAWGVTEWARRSAQGAYFDWLTANTILPDVDDNPDHTGIEKVDRTTVAELAEIPVQRDEIQEAMDKADAGLNPLGLAKNVVPFDIDPVQVERYGKTHFEQIYERAVKAMNNATAAWNQANKATELLRRNQDSVEKFQVNVADQERDFKNRLIEVFGYPYAGDIGAGKTYPSGYDGPDLYHYNYIDTTTIDSTTAPKAPELDSIIGRYKGLGGEDSDYFFSSDLPPNTPYGGDILEVKYPYSVSGYAFSAPTEWGQRRAPGEIQVALVDLVQSTARLREARLNYDKLIQDIEGEVSLLEAFGLQKTNIIETRGDLKTKTTWIMGTVAGANVAKKALEYGIDFQDRCMETSLKYIPKGFGDYYSPARGSLNALGTTLWYGMRAGVGILEGYRESQIAITESLANAAEQDIAGYEFDFEQQQYLNRIEQMVRQEPALRAEAFAVGEALNQNAGRYRAALAKGERLIEERVAYRKKMASTTTENRYQDMTFRIFRNDALQKYRAQFDLAARYVYLAAAAYDYEVNLLGSDSRAGQAFLTDLIRQRSLGQMVNGQPVIGQSGLADALARLSANFDVLKTQMGFNNPQTELGRFSLKEGFFRITTKAFVVSTNQVTGVISSDQNWQDVLGKCWVTNLWDVPEFRRHCRPFAAESAGAQPGLVIRFPSTVTFRLNFFGWPLGPGDSAYDPSRFATKVRSVGVWFDDYDITKLSLTPRVYLVPVGMDVLRAPSGNTLATRQWRVVDQTLPIPFPIGASALQDPAYIPVNDSLGGNFVEIRRHAGFRAYHSAAQTDMLTDSRLIGRSVWNTDWMLIIPGGTLHYDSEQGLKDFIKSVKDIKIHFDTYSYPGN